MSNDVQKKPTPDRQKSSTFYRTQDFQSGTPKKSLKPRRKRDFAHLASASFEEINRLTQKVSEQKFEIDSLNKELRTLKMVSSKQERALNQMDKETADFPHMMRVMTEELRVSKV
jgi:Ciliary protein causing Leber congenital amaurosis disease